MTRPQLGAKVRVTAVADVTGHGSRKWKRFECTPKEGMFIGVRFKKNGFTDEDGEYPYVERFFVQEETVEVWLVVTNIYHNPICAFPHDCEVIE